MNSSKFRIGVAQMDCVLGDLATNLATITDYVLRAEAQRVRLLVFPELALSGYSVRGRFHEMAVTIDSPEVERLRELSCRVSIAIGLIEETDDIDFFNSALYLSGGKIRHIHRKLYPPTYGVFEEKRYFGVGHQVRAFDTRLARMSMLVCGDCWHLGLPYLAVHDGADVLLFMAASSMEGLAETVDSRMAWHQLNRCCALTMGAFVVFANRAGSEEGLNFWGSSQIILPNGEVMAEGKQGQPDLVVAEVDMSALRKQRIALPFRRDDQLETTIRLARDVLERKRAREQIFVSELDEADLVE